MVDLPKVPRRLVTAEEPRSGLSRSDILAPYAAFSEAMQEGSKALDTFAESRVEDTAARAVTIGPDGNVAVERTPIPMVGKVGAHYDRLVRTGAVVQEDAIADAKIDELRNEHRANPAAFRAAAEAYRDERVGAITGTVGEAGGAALRRQMDNRINGSYSSLLNEHQARVIRSNNEALDARIVTLGNEIETLARRNGITGENGQPTPEYLERWQNLKTLVDEKVNNPLLAYPREKADAFLDTLNTRVQGAAIHEQMERIYRGEGQVNGRSGFEAAREYLKSAVRTVEGRVKETDKIERAGLAWLRSEEAGFRAERDAISREWSAAKGQASSLPREALLDLEQRAAAIGNARVAFDIATTRAALDTVSEIRALPVQEQVRIARTGGAGTLVDRIVGVESGGDPNARARTSSATGAGQFIRGTWLDLVKRSRPDLAQGKTDEEILALRTNPELSREMVGRYAQENQQKLAAAGVPTHDGALYLAHFLGPGDAIKVLSAPPGTPLQGLVNQASIDANRSIFDRNPTAGQLQQWATGKVGGAQSDLTQSRAGLVALGMVKKELAKDVGPRIDALADRMRRGEIPSQEDVAEVGSMVSLVGTPQQRRRAAELAVAAELGDQFQGLSAPQRDAAISAMEERLRQGGSQVESDLTATLRAQDKAISEAYKRDPYEAYYRYGRGDMATPTPPVDFREPVVAGAILQGRLAQQAVIREQEGMGPFPVLRPPEAEAFRGVMAQGDGRQVAAALGALNTLPDDVLAATLHQPAVKAGITAAIHTTDPTKMNAVMSSLDAWYKRDPQAFKAQFGDEPWNALKTWQSNLRYMTPEQFAEYQRKAVDPGPQAVRQKNIDAGKEEARKKKPEDVIAALTPFFSGFGFNQPAVPTDPQVRDMMMGDYQNIYSRRYADTLDKDQAHTQAAEAIGLKWQRSPLNGNEVMLRAPESVYPMVNGSHDWMAPQIETDIAARLGVPRREKVPVLSPSMAGTQTTLGLGPTNWDYHIVADATTEQEAQRYDRRLPASETNRPPSYIVIVRDNRRQTPQWAPQPGRIAFDPNTAAEVGRERFEAARAERERFEREARMPAGLF